MKWFFSAALSVVTLSALGWYFTTKPKAIVPHTAAKTRKKIDEGKEELQRLKTFGSSIEIYARNGNYNTRYCFLADMKKASGNNRFFVYDMKYDSIVDAGLVAHGSGTDPNSEAITFSNKPNSYCTSLGKYKIGSSYKGTFGLAYKLYGLDKTNDKAFDRFVVLHSHNCVPATEVAPGEICQSWGCPTVAPSFLTKLAGYIDKADKPILLWIFN
jgi:hypothetical protein